MEQVRRDSFALGLTIRSGGAAGRAPGRPRGARADGRGPLAAAAAATPGTARPAAAPPPPPPDAPAGSTDVPTATPPATPTAASARPPADVRLVAPARASAA